MDDKRLSIRLGVLLSLYIAEGLPSGLCTEALPAIMRSYHVPLEYIGYAGVLLFPWALKFLWAPYVDAWFSRRLGQRRSWILPTQLGGVVILLVIACFDPQQVLAGKGLGLFLGTVLLINFLAATHDIATDGLAVRLLQPGERGLGNGIQVGGYRLGLVVGGGLLLYVMGTLGWHASFQILALLLLLLLLPVFSLSEPPPRVEPADAQLPYLKVFTSFFALPGRRGWLLVLLVYKIGECLGSVMVKPMLIDMHYSLEQIGLMVSTLGSVSSLFGALLGGWLTGYISRYRAILLFGALQVATIGSYGWLAWHFAHGDPLAPAQVYACGMLEHFSAGMATAAILTAMMDMTRPEHAGADFTLQVCLLTVLSGLLYLAGGKLAHLLGYPHYYLFTGVVAGLLLLVPAVCCRRLPELWAG